MTAASGTCWSEASLISSSCFQVRYLICDLFNHHVLIAPTCVCWCVRGTRTLCGASCSRRRPLWGGPWPFKRRRSLLSWRTGGGGLKLSGTEISLSPLSLYTFTSVYFRCLWFILMYPRWDETIEDCEDMKREEGEEEHVPPPPPSPSLWHHVFIMSVRTSRSRDYLTCRESHYITDVQQDETTKWRQFISRRSKVKVTVTSSRSVKKHFPGRYATAWASLKADPPHSQQSEV